MDIMNRCYRCGVEPQLKTIHSYFYRVECSCGVIQNNLFQIQNLAIIDWNRFQQHYIAKMKPIVKENGNNHVNLKEVAPQKLTDAACRARIMRMKPDSLITIYEVARLCRASSDTIYLAIKKSELPFQYRPGKRKIRVVKKSDAISWRREHPPIKEEIREYINDIFE